ncbi:Protein TolB [termite gut metagenome]|uniref:Protein TolB n=1 Tax=termite gut metagenome TaxID=433724 RepID=A0A5J4SD33_9ZZZZ
MKRILYLWLLIQVCVACTQVLPEGKKSDQLPAIFPDYAETTIPSNIAPLNFSLTAPCKEAYAVLTSANRKLTVKASRGQFNIPVSKWKQLLASATGASVSVAVSVKEEEWISYAPFHFYVATEPVDPYIAYRLIEPGYEVWNRMGIYQRNLENYSESPIIENKMSGQNCMNCHSFCMQNPDKMLFHMRETYAGTLLIDGDKIEKLNTKTNQTISALVYPSWHPSGKYVAFSVNDTKQGFHQNDPNRIEVFDQASDVVVYDIEKHEIITTSALFSPEAFETFPTFSPDGKTLYFCSSPAHPIPQEFKEVRYNLCSISFDPEERRFGSTVDTICHAATEKKSASFPRVSPDGKYLLYTLSGYGNFSIWHKDADLYLYNLETKTNEPLDILNSDDVESYHSWSSNSRWVVFSSRRIDGLYTRPYIAYINTEGKASKPFLLPQKDTEFYYRFMKSYNIPEFITGKVKKRSRELGLKAKNDRGINVSFPLLP